MKRFKVYCHICPDDTRYIGITSQYLKTRWRKGGIGYEGQHFYEAVLKYGWNNIKHEVLFENLSEEEAYIKEIELIKQYDTTNPEHGWNTVVGGQVNRIYGEKNGNFGKHWFTNGINNIMAETCPDGFWRGKTDSDETKRLKKISNSRKRIPLSEEHKEKIRKAHLGRKMDEKTRQALLKCHLGKPISEEQKKKMSESARKRHMIIVDKNEFIDYISETFDKEINAGKLLFYQDIFGVMVDVYIPSKKLAFKLRGYVWDEDGYQAPIQDIRKLLQEGIRLINVYDYEWLKIKDNFKRFIYYMIRSRGKRLLTSTDVVTVEKDEFISFLKDNHLFSDTIKGCSIMLGIKQDEELVAVAGFDKKSRKYDWEWKRFAIKYGWMTEHNVAQLFLDEFSKDHKGILVDYQQMDRFPITTDEEMGFTKVSYNSGVVSINTKTMNFTRHSFIPEKPLTKMETMIKYGFDAEIKTAGTTTWVKRIE